MSAQRSALRCRSRLLWARRVQVSATTGGCPSRCNCPSRLASRTRQGTPAPRSTPASRAMPAGGSQALAAGGWMRSSVCTSAAVVALAPVWPFTTRSTSIAAALSPVALSRVASGSMITLITASSGRASGPKPKAERITISAVIPPVGIALTTTAARTEIPTIAASTAGVSSRRKRLTANRHLATAPITEPSL